MSEQDVVLNIIGKRVALGPMRRDLIPLYTRWENDFGTTRTLARADIVTVEQWTQRYDWIIAATETIHFTIYERPGVTDAEVRPIGFTYLTAIDHRNRTAEFGIVIGEAAVRGKGYGTETTRLMLDYAFTALGLHNVMLTVYAYNVAGQRAYAKAGFREYARRQECHQMGGRLWDMIYMECLATDFTSPVLAPIFAPDTRGK
jgi:RimJ/RimL family protein N-acetyltransferase